MKVTIYGKWSEQSKEMKGLLVTENGQTEQSANKCDSECEAEFNITGILLKKIADKSQLDSNYRNIEIVSNMKNAVGLMNEEYTATTSRGKAFVTFLNNLKKWIDFTIEYTEISEQEVEKVFSEKFPKKQKSTSVETKEMKRGFRKISPKPTFSDITDNSAPKKTYSKEEEENFQLVEYALKKYAKWSDTPEMSIRDMLKAGEYTCLECTLYKPNGFAEMTMTEYDLMKSEEKVNPKRKLEMLYVIDFNHKKAMTSDYQLEVIMTTAEESKKASLIPTERRIALLNILPVDRCRAGNYIDLSGYNDKRSRIEAILEECKREYGSSF